MRSIEIESKFLLRQRPEKLSKYAYNRIDQGYIVRAEHIEIRLRKKSRSHTLTIKKGKAAGERFEKEIPITVKDFRSLWSLTKGRRLTKIRYNIPYQRHRIELDVYQGKLKGLITAEVEFKNRADRKKFVPPDWFDEEITQDSRYSNWSLATRGLPKENAFRKR